MKKCIKCLVRKPLHSFGKDRKSVTGVGHRCKECNNIQARLWRAGHRERVKEKRRKKKYGISGDQYREMLAEQGGGCAICGSRESGNSMRPDLVVDHCHRTGRVRGLLCNHCNWILGRADDDPELLKKTARYLKKRRNIVPEKDKCVVCRAEFDSKHGFEVCSTECQKKRIREWDRSYRKQLNRVYPSPPTKKRCVVCNAVFHTKSKVLVCSPECSHEKAKAVKRAHYRTPKGMTTRKAYASRPENLKRAARLRRERRQDPEYRKKNLEYQREYKRRRKAAEKKSKAAKK